MYKCDLMKDGKCVCAHKCARLLAYESAIHEFEKALLVNEVIDKSVVRRVAAQLIGVGNDY